MLRIVNITASDANTLLTLSKFSKLDSNTINGLEYALEYFQKNPKKQPAQFVCDSDQYKKFMGVLNAPFMPIDAEKSGLTLPWYLELVKTIPEIRRKFEDCEFSSREFFAYENMPSSLLN